MNPRDAYLLQAQDGRPPAPDEQSWHTEAQALDALDCQLRALLGADPAASSRIMAQVRAQAQRPPRPSSRIMAKVRRQRVSRRPARSSPQRWYIPMAVAAAAALVATLALTWPRAADDGQAMPRLLGGQLAGELRPGSELEALADARLEDGQGAELALAAGSRLRLAEGSRPLQLLSGETQVSVGSQQRSQPWAMATPHLQLQVLGTAFSVSVDQEGSRVAVHQGRVAIARLGQPSGELGPGEHLRVWDAQRVNWQQPAAELTQHLRRGRWQDEQGLRPQHQLEDQSLHRWDLIWQIPVQSQAPVQRLSPLAGSLQLDLDLALECRLQLVLGLHDPTDGSFVSNLILTWDGQTGDARRSLDLSDPSLRRFSEPEQNLDRLLDIRRAHLTAYSMPDPGLQLRNWGWSAP